VYLDKRMESIADYVAAIRNNTIKGLSIPSGRCDLRGNERVILPVDIRDKQDRSSGKDWRGLLGV